MAVLGLEIKLPCYKALEGKWQNRIKAIETERDKNYTKKLG
jgi:hypothetical protein